MTLTRGRRLRRIPGSKFKVQSACGAFQVPGSRFKVPVFSTAAGHGGVRFDQGDDGGFGNFRKFFRHLVPMNMDSGSSPE
jgi:hypothetical protein